MSLSSSKVSSGGSRRILHSSALSGAANPWSGRETVLGLKLGDPQCGLTVARRHGLLPHTREQMREDVIKDKVKKCSSVRMIKLLEEMANLNSELQQLELEIHRRLLDRSIADLTHTEILESRLLRVDGILSHLTDVVHNKDTLVGRLQTRAADNSLKIEAPFQKHASQVVGCLGPTVSTLPVHYERIQQVSSLNISKTPLSEKLSKGRESFAQCRTAHQTCQDLYDVHHKQKQT